LVANQEASARSTPLDLVGLRPLMAVTAGDPSVLVALLDGPVACEHPDLSGAALVDRSSSAERCGGEGSPCAHGTFVAGILVAARGSSAPAICPRCRLLVRPIFHDRGTSDAQPLSATPDELADGIVECVDAGAAVINLSLTTGTPTMRSEERLGQALDYAMARRAIVVAAAGNQGTVGTSEITRHPWVIPVAACDRLGRPMEGTNLAASIGRRGLAAPGEVTSLGIDSAPRTLVGTSFAAALVTGVVALLKSAVPSAPAAVVHRVVTASGGRRLAAITPPLLDAWAAYLALGMAVHSQRGV